MTNFWKKAWYTDKRLFIFFLLFVAGQAFFTYKGVENIPFWNYGMYSAPLGPISKLETWTLLINDQKIVPEKYPRLSSIYLSYQLKYFWQWEKAGYHSPEEATVRQRLSALLSAAQVEIWVQQLCTSAEKAAAFGDWLQRYLQIYFDEKIERIDLVYQTFEAQAPYSPIHKDVRQLYPNR